VSKMQSVVKAEMPSASQSDIFKEVGERWRTLSAEGREPFEALAEADKKRYQVGMHRAVSSSLYLG
jgi:hypothetical protein